MGNKSKFLIKFFKLILEGRTLIDKIKIILWFFGIRNSLFLKNKDGLFFVRKNSADLWMMSPLGEGEFRKYFDLKEGVFLDIGANIGKYSIMIGKQMSHNGKVYAFEPEPNNLKYLRKNIKLNKIKNIEIVEKACSNSKGKINFYLNPENTGGHSIVNKNGTKISVQTDTLDNFIKENKISRVDLIKIDVEGAELLVLEGAKNLLIKFKPKIIFETDFPEKVFPFLEKKNYKIKRIAKRDYFAEKK